ncbi:glycosyltransferase [Listeria booriae]|uniref:glycosyltransferase n=1 Tax=Listeria booriae TaxID=1552123 RepID=UPI00162703D8|nr:glycosyltransferase [Listeria booriae]MBC1975238.1 colanic acid biosynthesis glycosyltransferase WcaL [Listeria booriae]MBC1985518.1 colanic acid biosynthesis glycosyltransferase WcaL [Listeria booriae]MBC2032530.1 colanic acid biosynthesis glycosyltransferase WcaL [Listeria booriae]MBC2264725.1 colanic acid biosynthesis glycosyltransferase WcaL [Listeria booriae]
MKVLFLISSFPALSETFILNQITGFIDRGVDVEIVAWNKVNNEKNHPEIEKYSLLEKTYFLNNNSVKSQRLIGGLKIAAKSIWKAPKATCQAFNYRKYGKMIFTVRFLYALPYFLKRQKFDAVICHYGPSGIIAAYLQNQKLLPENVMTFFHGNDVTTFVKKYGSKVYDSLFAADIKLLPVSHQFARLLKAYGANSEQIQVHRMGIDLDKFHPVKPSILGETVNFLSIGRLTEKKGMDVAIKTMYELKKRGLRISLEIIGEGALRNDLEALIINKNLENEVTLLGWQSQTEVKQYIEKADFVLQLSKTASDGDKEGVPVALMETMARGKLVISTHHSGIPELITNNKHGWLVAEDSVSETTEKIIEVIHHPEIWAQISEQARNKIHHEFNIKKLNDTLIASCAGGIVHAQKNV